MRLWPVAMLLFLNTCVDIDEDQIVDDCKIVAQAAAVAAVKECQRYYEQEVIPQLEYLLEECTEEQPPAQECCVCPGTEIGQ